MVEDYCYVPVYYDFIESTASLTDAQVGQLVRAIVAHARGDDPRIFLKNRKAEMVFEVCFRATIERHVKRLQVIREKRRQVASMGGRARADKIAAESADSTPDVPEAAEYADSTLNVPEAAECAGSS